MYYIAWLLAIFLLYLLFDGMVEKRNNPNQQPVSHSTQFATDVILKRNSAGHYVTNGSINNIEVTLLVDTGATDIAVPENIARELGLSKGLPIQVSTANGISRAWLTTIDSLKIGDIQLFNLKASINPGMNHSDEVLLGMAALRHLDFSQKGDSLILKQLKSPTKDY
jgi:aspartyl protease family protein